MSTINKPRSLREALESRQIAERSTTDYRQLVRGQYDGAAGALTAFTGFITGHETLAGKIINPHAFDVSTCRSILDAGCGNGRYSVLLQQYAPADARLTACDLSVNMLARARKRLDDPRADYCSADVTKLPFADGSFDAAVCGWVLEHLPDPRPALREFHRVLQPGGKFLLMVTEDTFNGAVCSRLWHCRTYNRKELRAHAEECGFEWAREYWFTRLHRTMGLGGVKVELIR